MIDIAERLEDAENPLEILAIYQELQELQEHRDWERLDRWCMLTYGRRVKCPDQADWDRWTLITQIRVANRNLFRPLAGTT